MTRKEKLEIILRPDITEKPLDLIKFLTEFLEYYSNPNSGGFGIYLCAAFSNFINYSSGSEIYVGEDIRKFLDKLFPEFANQKYYKLDGSGVKESRTVLISNKLKQLKELYDA